MSKYEDIGRELESLHKDLFVDDIGEKSIDIIIYADNTDDLLEEIYNVLSHYDKNNFLYNVRIGREQKNELSKEVEYLYLSYICNIGEDEESEEELRQKAEDSREELAFETQREIKRGIY
ncbi:MAG: hypothetical protein EOL97_14525 [Spirochaetia bacterium]|nr:hypothetical protein [Spirochaetia bacterium]